MYCTLLWARWPLTTDLWRAQWHGESSEDRERSLHEARAELDKRMDALRKQNEEFYTSLRDASHVRRPMHTALLCPELLRAFAAVTLKVILFCVCAALQKDKTRYRDAIRKVDESIAILEQLFDETRKNLERLLGAEVRARYEPLRRQPARPAV